ncbi:hypothetical protein ABZU76_12650 [Amycolatopsis sp. NPDC005232]|uniref:hypothetical protein n=1 Tax=Amycolatopsis sp. NPDC005232 TaxID=3157027 RepID=UPI0033AB1872
MRAITISNDTRISRSPEEVYDYVTKPENWVGTHPVTVAVRDAPEGSAVAGTRWIEVIGAPGTLDEGGYDTEWLATTSVPGHTWVIETDRLRFDGVRCQIVYTLMAEGSWTYFRRDMTVLVAAGADLDPVLEKKFMEDSAHPGDSVHAGYLAAVKAALER